MWFCVGLDGSDDHPFWISPVFLNLEILAVTHLDNVTRVILHNRTQIVIVREGLILVQMPCAHSLFCVFADATQPASLTNVS